jgi:ABC-type dipeptide/oligopeptide/nickel transport system permease component
VDALIALNFPLFVDALRHLVLPVITLSLLNVATMARMTRASLLEVLHQEYIRTARAKGLAERVVVYRHALRNALIPVLTVLGFRIGYLLGGAVIVETIFAWPGMGRRAVLALQLVDIPVVAAFTIYVTAGYALINLLIDMSYSRLDPRIRRT